MEEERRRCTKEVSCQPFMKIVGETWVTKYSETFLMSRPRLKRVEAKEARERGLAFRNPNTFNTRESNTFNTKESNNSKTKASVVSNTREPNISNTKA